MPELPRSDANETGLMFSLEGMRQQPIDYSWSHHWLSTSGEKLLSYCNQGSYHWLHFPGLADFRISATTKKISCFPCLEVSRETIRHLLLEQVLPRCLAHQGKVMLHASAVQHEQGLLLFIGDSGAGKSTLAGNFHQAGNPALSDDCLRVKADKDQIRAVPSYRGLRLWQDSLEVLFATQEDADSMVNYASKKRVPLKGNDLPGSGNGFPVLAMIVLSSPGHKSPFEVGLERVSHREAFIAILRQTFQLNLMDLEKMTGHVQALARIVPRVPVFHLSMPRDYALLPTVRQKILETVL